MKLLYGLLCKIRNEWFLETEINTNNVTLVTIGMIEELRQ